MILQLFLLFVAAIVAFWISAICGGGASLILIPFLNILLPTSLVPFSITVGTFSSSATRIAVFRKHIHWKIVFWFVPFSIPAVLLGAFLIKYITPSYLQLIVAVLLLANIPQLLKSKKKEHSSEKPTSKSTLAIVGFLAGFVSGITGAIGLLFNRFYLKYGLTKEEIIATRAANEIVLHFIKLVIYILLGLFSTTALWIGLVIAVATFVSSYTIQYILPYISEFLFKKIGYSAMVLAGFVLLTSTSYQIIEQDNIRVSKNTFNETTIDWRMTNFVVEFSLDDGLEIEKQIPAEELPENLKAEYEQLLNNYDFILIEKVFKLNTKPSYEFYCYKNDVFVEKIKRN